MMSLTFGLFTQVSGLGPLGPLVSHSTEGKTLSNSQRNTVAMMKIIQSLFIQDLWPSKLNICSG